ncbi:hypothetical protein SAMN04487949_2860 [Halogranum gelatinilyticum]|uniref:DUF7982 domain-containing protein n=1 Tax=Halogranum gelatinilyticum TaxID=660521 RepID=A0A1G9X6L8_9EURY|nr:hypothetical protein [Halogranum gelatinilyticum]SDM92342.1 hypothetical protein SAMN04487949_2860 [Halogranum gelatinilyticum]
MSQQQPSPEDTQTDRSATDSDLRAELELLREENQRLRGQYVRARRTSYRQSALGLVSIGVVSAIGALLFPAAQTVLFALAGIGLFAGVLTYYLTPERFIAADVGERIYAALMTNETAIVRELGLSDTRVYIPHERQTARLFVPQHSQFDVPSEGDLESTFVVTENERERGLALRPTGRNLFEEFEQTLSGPLGTTPHELRDQLTDALVNVFEVVEATTTDLDAEDGRLTVAVTDSAYTFDDDVDHPVASFVAVGLATGLGTPIQTTVTTEPGNSDDVDFRVTCRWERDNSTSPRD